MRGGGRGKAKNHLFFVRKKFTKKIWTAKGGGYPDLSDLTTKKTLFCICVFPNLPWKLSTFSRMKLGSFLNKFQNEKIYGWLPGSTWKSKGGHKNQHFTEYDEFSYWRDLKWIKVSGKKNCILAKVVNAKAIFLNSKGPIFWNTLIQAVEAEMFKLFSSNC